ncbi:hypothetical protein BDC45DRAFT_561276 [Circinella umbellata]|nr:hypothetical protein BDC45DRAFT_561276 [Circinella umbellata]
MVTLVSCNFEFFNYQKNVMYVYFLRGSIVQHSMLLYVPVQKSYSFCYSLLMGITLLNNQHSGMQPALTFVTNAFFVRLCLEQMHCIAQSCGILVSIKLKLYYCLQRTISSSGNSTKSLMIRGQIIFHFASAVILSLRLIIFNFALFIVFIYKDFREVENNQAQT